MPASRGQVVAVWGPHGSPGRSTVAVTLADELSRFATALVIDADAYGGVLASMLGVLDESPGLAAACRQAGGQRLNGPDLAALCWQLSPSLRLLSGIPLSSRWPELRPSAVPAVLAAARELADWVVVDCGFCLEADEELSYDTMAPRRNGATLAVLDAADVVVAVGACDPIGLQRLVRGVAELREATAGRPVGAPQVLLNKVRRQAVPGDAAAEAIDAMDRFAGVRPTALLPYDPASLDRAVEVGRSVGEACPASPFRRAVAEYAAELAGRPRPHRHRRRGRPASPT